MESQTIKALGKLTDPGLFERVATAAIRLIPEYAAIGHPGINRDGKTQKSPVDGICFIDNDRSHMLVAHHTITHAKGLRKKWLFDPSTVERKTGSKSPLPEAGDLLKTLEVVRAERQRTLDLSATLILTTNTEPNEDVVRDVVAIGRANDVKVDIWSRSAIASLLDTRAEGQLIRRKLLAIEEELLSQDLLLELSAKNVSGFHAGDTVSTRVPRKLDTQLVEEQRPILFLVASSGTGKTVACHKFLASRVASGELAFVISHQAIEGALTPDQALMATLRHMKPSLLPDQAPSQLLAGNRSMTILIEDITASPDPRRLIEKIASWHLADGNGKGHFPWSIICPVWPHLVAGISSHAKNRIAAMEFRPDDMSSDEATSVAIANAGRAGVHLQDHQARVVAQVLGNDPLLIGLNENWSQPNGELTIGRFAEDVLNRAGSTGDILATELRQALLEFGVAMLEHSGAAVPWNRLMKGQLPPATVSALRQIARNGELFRVDGASADAVIKFRHDRVRDWLMAESGVELHTAGELNDKLVAEPMLAEVLASILIRTDVPLDLAERVTRQNPLALFHAMRLAGPKKRVVARLAQLGLSWLQFPENRGRATKELRWQALAAIMDVESQYVPELIALFPPDWVTGQIARMRNGDLEGGVALCSNVEPHKAVIWLKPAIAALRAKSERDVDDRLNALVQGAEVANADRCNGLLSLAGIWGSPALAPSVLILWQRDEKRSERLAYYLWALARCSTVESAPQILADLCQIWSELPEARDGVMPSPKDQMASDTVRWAFERAPPLGALPFLMERAGQPDLAWQIEYLLHGMDVPDVIFFHASRGADRRRRSTDSYFVNSRALHYWRSAEDRQIKPMSSQSRAAMLALWDDPSTDENLRIATFDLWSMNSVRSELPTLVAHEQDAPLKDRVFKRRAELGDQAVIPELLSRLDNDKSSRDWHYTQYLWSAEVYAALDRALAKLSKSSARPEKKADVSFSLTRVILRLDVADGERLLLKYWDCLGETVYFVQAALHVGTAQLLDRAQRVIAASRNPAALFDHLTMHYGIRTSGEAGITRESQILNLEPYLAFVERSDLWVLTEVCNENGWFDTRVRVLDARLKGDERNPLNRMLDALADYSKRGRPGPIEWDVERLLETGVAWSDVLGYLRDWLSTQNTPVALEIFARALRDFGRREDLDEFSHWSGNDKELLEQVVRDTRFAVWRRTF